MSNRRFGRLLSILSARAGSWRNPQWNCHRSGRSGRAGCTITIESTETGTARQLTTNSSGLFNAPNLTPGTYKLTVSAPGFSNVLRTNLSVSVGTESVVNIPLQIGNTASTVEVRESAPAVDAASSSTGAVVEGPTVRQLPLNGRDWTSLAALEPGVAVVRTQPSQGLSITRSNRGLGAQMTINGNRPQQNNYRLDGVSVNDYAGGSPASVLGQTLGVDAIQEFSVVTGNAPADYGKSSGAVVNAVTRSGTNSFHGTAYEFLRNSALDARNFFDGSVAPPFKRNQFGGSDWWIYSPRQDVFLCRLRGRPPKSGGQ